MNIIFMRHGEATDNVRGIISDKAIYWSVLTENGVKVVAETTKGLPQKIDKVYFSPLPRTIQTAHIVRDRFENLEYIEDDRIKEIQYGKYSGRKNNEDLDNVRRLQVAGDYQVRFGDYGENRFDIESRLSDFLLDVYSNNDPNDTILIISHGSITSYMKRILKLNSPHLNVGKADVFENVDFSHLIKHSEKLKGIANLGAKND